MYSRALALLLLVLLSLTTLAAGQTPSFVARKDFSVSDIANWVTTADLNGDGIPDMVAADGTNVSVLLGNGDGTFQPAVNFAAGGKATFVIVADLNGDGIPDLAVGLGDASTSSNMVSILLGNGDGTFQAAMQFTTGTNGNYIAIGDFNGDSIPDLAVTNRGLATSSQPSTVSVLLGNGDGTFGAATNYTVGVGPTSVVAVDLNGDGALDLVVTNWGHVDTSTEPTTYIPDTTISVLFGNGDGTFQQAQNQSVGTGPLRVIAGDFNGDGNPDLIVATEQSSTQNRGSLVVLFGDGQGGLHNGGTYIVGSSPRDLISSDVNGDGIPDLLVGHASLDNNSGALNVLLGNGDGTFQAPSDVAVGSDVFALAAGDFNRDGKLDVALTVANKAASVILGNGDGTFQTPPAFPAGQVFGAIVTADFNNDGNADVAVTNQFDNTVSILLGNGDGTLGAPQTIPVAQSPEALAVADLNGDGIPDLVVGNAASISNNIYVLLGNGDGTFQPAIILTGVNEPHAIAVGDFNGDGIPDLIVAGAGGSNGIYLGNGDGTFQNATPFTSLVAGFMAVGDFNRDGKLDIAITNRDQGLVILSGNGDGTFQQFSQMPFPGGSLQQLGVADLNGDGIPDLVVTMFPNVGTANDVFVMLGNGDGTFSDPVGYMVGDFAKKVSFADVTGDGIVDLIVETRDAVAVLAGNGDGGFQPALLFGPGGPGVAADFNNDGKIDLATPHLNNPRGVVLLINNQP